MKKVKYVGQVDVFFVIGDNHYEVKQGDILEVPADFLNANFEDVVEKAPKESK